MSTAQLVREKRALRAEMRLRLRQARDAERDAPTLAGADVASAVARAVAGSEAFRCAERVALYASLPDELPTRPIFDAIIAAGKLALFPRCVGDSLEFAPASSWDSLVEGAFRTREPAPSSAAEGLGAGDLVLVPGLAFDRRGGRLGRGRGFYDRAFEGGGVPFLCGVAYAAQLVERVPVGRYDVAMRAIATEEGWETVAPAADNKTGGA